jgi:hypothetical protein
MDTTERQIMNLSDIAARGVLIFGDTGFRGECPKEDLEQVTFFARLRREYPETWGMIAIHPRNEGLKVRGQIGSVARHKAEGMTPGAADIVLREYRKGNLFQLPKRNLKFSIARS